jgi:hypothetical protein
LIDWVYAELLHDCPGGQVICAGRELIWPVGQDHAHPCLGFGLASKAYDVAFAPLDLHAGVVGVVEESVDPAHVFFQSESQGWSDHG